MIKSRYAWFYLLPSFAGLIFVYIHPFFSSLRYAVLSDSIPRVFVGIESILRVLKSELFQMALGNTLFLILTCCALSIAFAFIGACALKERTHISNVSRVAVLLPYITPVATMLFIWRLFFGNMGYISQISARFFGIRPFFLTTDYLLIPVITLFLWRNVGVQLIILLSSMNTVEPSYYEYAELEGATLVQRHVYITLPILAPMIAFTVFLSWNSTMKIFKEIYLLSGGYPSDRLYTIQHYMNNQFAFLNYGNLVISSVSTLVIVWCAYLVVLWGSRRMEEWGGAK